MKYTLCSSPHAHLRWISHASFLCPALCLIFLSICNTTDPVISLHLLLFSLFRRTSSHLSPLKKTCRFLIYSRSSDRCEPHVQSSYWIYNGCGLVFVNIKALLCKSEVCMLCMSQFALLHTLKSASHYTGQDLHHHFHISFKKALSRYTQKLNELHYKPKNKNKNKSLLNLKKL